MSSTCLHGRCPLFATALKKDEQHSSLTSTTSTAHTSVQTPESILDVGAIGSYSEYDGWTDRQFETYMLFNGLSVDTDPVLGDYTVWTVNGNPGKDYTIAVRLGGELVLEEKGSSDSEGQSPKFTVTVTDYYDSDCTLKLHGEKSQHERLVGVRHYALWFSRLFPHRVQLGG